MGAVTEEGYKPPSDYLENAKDSLVNLDMTGSTELWLMQFPANVDIDFDQKEVNLNLRHNGKLGSFEGSSGKAYDLVGFSSQEPDATVFASYPSKSKVVGKISRLVSIVNYPEPSELKNNQKQRGLSLSSSSSMKKSSRHLATPSRSMQRNSMSRSAASTHSSRQKSALSEEVGEPSKTSKSTRVDSSGSLRHSHQNKSKSKIKS